MIEETATVSRYENGKVWLETQINSTCSSCVQSTDCGTSVVAKAFSGKTNTIILDCSEQLEPGQQVLLGIKESAVVSASTLIYLLPCLLFVMSALASDYLLVQNLKMNELTVIASSILVTVAGFILLKKHLNAPQNLAKYHPQIVDIKPQPFSSDIKITQLD